MPESILLASTWWSFGRDRQLLHRAETLIESEGAKLYDVWADPDLNRCLLAFSAPEPFMATLVADLAEAILPSIDLRRHTGAHPRTGALDLVRFTSLAGATDGKTIQELAERLAVTLDIPVLTDGPLSLPGSEARILKLRAGGFGVLWNRPLQPDFGPAMAHERYGVTILQFGPLQVYAALEIQDSTCRTAHAVASTLSELRSEGDPLLLGVMADGYSQPTREGSLLMLAFEFPDSADPDRVLKVAEKEAKLMGAAAGRARALGLWRRSDLPRANRLTISERQLWD